MLLNAERRLCNKQYDDAVARLYRTIELLAQTRLKQEHQLETGDIESQRLPHALQASYERLRNERNGLIQLPLMKSYALLNELNDPFGQAISPHLPELEPLLRQRNTSILAHGMQPIRSSQCLALHKKTKAVIELLFKLEGISKGRTPAIQFPVQFS